MIRYSSLHVNMTALGRSLGGETAAGMTLMGGSLDNCIKLFVSMSVHLRGECTYKGQGGWGE